MSNPIPKNGIKKPSDFMKEKQAIENAKVTEDAKQPINAGKALAATDTPKAEDKTTEAKSEAPKKTKRKTSEDWEIILNSIDDETYSIPEAAVEYGVSTSNIYQQRTKRKQALAKKEVASLSSNTIVEDAKKLISTVDKELEDFDKEVEDAKSKVANAPEARAKIEAKTAKYQAIIDLFKDETVDSKDKK